MKKIVLIYGTIGGLIVAGMIFVNMPLTKNPDYFKYAELTGYATMVIALSTIFVGIKVYRDKYLGGKIKFGKAFLLGLYISLVASFIYATGWEVFLRTSGTTVQDFMQTYTRSSIEHMKAEGASAEKIKATMEQTSGIMEWYTNPFLRFMFTMCAEMLPVGLIVSLISAAILRKKEVLPMQQ